MVFWWTGRGFLVLLTPIVVYALFGSVVSFAVGNDAFERFPWLWGIAALLSAGATWYIGCRLNKKSFTLPKLKAIPGRFIYRGRHRFLSLPLETWALPMSLLGAFLVVRGLLFHTS